MQHTQKKQNLSIKEQSRDFALIFNWMIYECITHRQQNGLTVQYQFLNRANVYFRPTGYYIKNPHRADGKAACQQMKRKKKKQLSLLKASWTVGNNWKLKLPLSAHVFSMAPEHQSTTPLQDLWPQHTSAVTLKNTHHAHSSSEGAEVDVVVENIWLLFKMLECKIAIWRRMAQMAQGFRMSYMLFKSQMEACGL